MTTQQNSANPAGPSDSLPASVNPALAGDASLDRRLLLGAAGLAGVAALGAITSRASAGPLNPPAGAVAGTGKPIGELEPRVAVNATNTPGNATYVFVISSLGSYYLTGNITVPSGRTGVYLAAGATLDLNGFTINGAGSTSVGIQAGNGCTIRGGTVSNVSGAVVVGISPATAVLIEDLVVTGFSSRGLDLGGGSVVRRCTLTGQGITGIELQGDYGLVESCQVNNTSATGIYLNSYSVARGCLLNRCGIGLRLGFGSVAESCNAVACNDTGIQAGQRSVVKGCTAINVTVGFSGSAGVGFDLADGAEAVGSAALSCFVGIRASTGGRIIECTADACSSAAVRLTGSGNTVDACRLNRSSIGIDMTGVSGNYMHKCVLAGNTNPIAVNIGGNWYPNVALASTNTATNPLASVIA